MMFGLRVGCCWYWIIWNSLFETSSNLRINTNRHTHTLNGTHTHTNGDLSSAYMLFYPFGSVYAFHVVLFQFGVDFQA